MRSISFLSLSFVLATFAITGCAVGSSAPGTDGSSSDELNGAAETVSISRDSNPSIPRDEVRSPNVNDQAIAKTANLLATDRSRLGDTAKLGDVIKQRQITQLEDGTQLRVDGTLNEPGTLVQRINVAGEGRAVVHAATGTPLDRRDLADDPQSSFGVGGDPNP